MSLVLSRMPLPDYLTERLQARVEAYLHPSKPLADAPAEVLARADVLFTPGNMPAVAADFALMPNLRLVACYGSGHERIDVLAARARGVAVTNSPSVNHDCVADLTWALLLASARQIVNADAYARSGRWAQRAPGGPKLRPTVHGGRLGILGLGAIGRAVAERAAGFRMEVAYCGRRAKPDAPWRFVSDVADLAAWSDHLVVALRASEDTRHIVDEPVLRALGAKGTLINISRGIAVDEAALVRGLQEGWVGGAALDVFEREPEIPAELRALPHLVLTPHIGGLTNYSFEKQLDIVLDNIEAVRAGRPPLTPV
jgi:lactate dehydrogenase-like 2-hydroxyacid dehydrogenase